MSLYDDLGVSADATPDELRAAHRRQVKKHHPDKGGVREDFDKVTHAYLVLRDPKTRQKYDETGDDQIAPDNELSEIASMLVSAFDQAMMQAPSPRLADLIKSMRDVLSARKAEALGNATAMEEAAARFGEVLERITFSGDGVDILASAMRNKIAEAEKLRRECLAAVAQIERAEAYAADYGYRFDQPPPMANRPNWPFPPSDIYREVFGGR